MMKATIRPKRPVASASAKPSSAGIWIWPWLAGLRAIEATSEEKMLPMPMPAPTSAMQARPAPIILAEARSMGRPFSVRGGDLVEVDRVVEVDAGEDREDVGLQHRDENLEEHERRREGQRQDAEDAEAD